MVTITESAAKHIKEALSARGSGLGIRLGIQRSGCSGYAYVMNYVDVEDENDAKFEFNDATLYIDKKSLIQLYGTELDYTREGLNEGFKFNNPNVTSQCGCGESFNT